MRRYRETGGESATPSCPRAGPRRSRQTKDDRGVCFWVRDVSATPTRRQRAPVLRHPHPACRDVAAEVEVPFGSRAHPRRARRELRGHPVGSRRGKTRSGRSELTTSPNPDDAKLLPGAGSRSCGINHTTSRATPVTRANCPQCAES